MKLLCIKGDYNFLPSNEIMNNMLIEGLFHHSIFVDIVTFRNQCNGKFRKVYKINGKKQWFKWLSSTKFRLFYFLWINIVGYMFVRPYKKNDLNEIDLTPYDIILVLCPPPLSAIITRDILLKSEGKKRVIQYWTDPLSIGMLNKIDSIPLKRLIHKIVEKKILSWGDEIVYCSPVLCNAQKKVFTEFAHKMRWTDVAVSRKYTSEIEKSQRLKKDRILVGYFGSFHKNVRNIKPLIDSFKYISNAELIIRGDSNLHLSELEIGDNVDISIGRIPYENIKNLEAKCDILVCIGNLSGVQIPGKVFYYALHDKPIIYVGDGFYNPEIIDYLYDLERYIVSENNSNSIVDSLEKAIDHLSNINYTLPKRLYPESVAEKIINGLPS
ncbi:MAG: hypothetical protein ACQEW9_09810 [Bacteroidota bacterium]